MLNHIVIQGRLTRNIEVKYTQSNKAVTSFTLACDRGWDNEADFINCVAWEKTAQFIQKYFAKGDMILIDGRLQSRSYEDKNGSKRTAYDVLVSSVNFCGSRKAAESTAPAGLTEPEDEGDNSDLPF